jgi:hypothetical protein
MNTSDSRNLGTVRDKERFWEGKISPVFRGGGHQTYTKFSEAKKFRHEYLCSKWLNTNKDTAYWKVLICSNVQG